MTQIAHAAPLLLPPSQNGSPWRRTGAGKFELIVDPPSEWEKLLDRLGLSDKEAVRIVTGQSVKAGLLREFVSARGRSRYVPEKVLQKLGRVEWEG
jgi:hypothetical protein